MISFIFHIMSGKEARPLNTSTGTPEVYSEASGTIMIHRAITVANIKSVERLKISFSTFNSSGCKLQLYIQILAHVSMSYKCSMLSAAC